MKIFFVFEKKIFLNFNLIKIRTQFRSPFYQAKDYKVLFSLRIEELGNLLKDNTDNVAFQIDFFLLLLLFPSLMPAFFLLSH